MLTKVNLRGQDIDTDFVTPAEAESRGLTAYNAPCEPGICKYCGKAIEPLGFLYDGKVYWYPVLFACDCAQAQADRQKIEAMAENEAKAERERRRTAELYIGSGMKERSKEQTFENFVREEECEDNAWWQAKLYAESWDIRNLHGQGMRIEGGTGTGKTHLANAVSNKLIPEGVAVVFTSHGAMLREIKQAYDNKWDSCEALKRFERADLLIIDDLGKESCTEWGIDTLYDILDSRYMSKAPVLITTNLSDKGLADALTPKSGTGRHKAESIVSRIRETSKHVRLTGKDRRKTEVGYICDTLTD